METSVRWPSEDTHRGCNDPGSLYVNMKRTSTSIESDLDSGYQEASLDNRPPTPATSKDSQGESDVDSIDRDINSDNEIHKSKCDVKLKDYDQMLDENCRLLLKGKEELPANWCKLSRLDKLKIIEDFTRKYNPNVPESLIRISVGIVFPGDTGVDASNIPDWLDKEKFDRGQRFARENIFGILYSNGMALYTLYSFADGLKPVIMTGKSSDPYTSFKRFLSTTNRVRNWCYSDPWKKGSPAYNDIQAVRRLHVIVRNKLSKLSLSELDKLATIETPMAERTELLLEDFRAACPAPKLGQCPHLDPELRERRPIGLNQGEMGFTQFGFIGLPLLFPESFGIHYATEEDFEAFCHLWRGLGYLLGIADEFNFCRGGLKETRQRCKDFLEYWIKPNFRDFSPEFEHMIRCVYEGLNFYIPGSNYESSLLYLTDLMDIPMPQLRASMSYSVWFRYNLLQHLFYYSFRFNWVKAFLNKRINAILDKATAFDSEKHKELRERSEKVVSEVLANIHSEKYKQIGDL